MAQRYVPSPQRFCVVMPWSLPTITGAEEFPTLRPGLWEYQRTTQRSDHAWEPKDLSRRVSRAKGAFDIVASGVRASLHQKYCTRLFAADGYAYA